MLFEWQIKDWINSAISAKADAHEVHALRSTVDRLEHSLREARTEIDGLRGQCEELQTRVHTLNCQ